MTSSKNPKEIPPGVPHPPNDLERNPGIGGSKGAFARTGMDGNSIDADTTFEGDVENGTDADGGIESGKLGRTNK